MESVNKDTSGITPFVQIRCKEKSRKYHGHKNRREKEGCLDIMDKSINDGGSAHEQGDGTLASRLSCEGILIWKGGLAYWESCCDEALSRWPPSPISFHLRQPFGS